MMTANPPPSKHITANHQSKVQNFIGRKFIFDTIQTFINQYSRGYFTLVSFPGMGKSTILSQYVFKNPQTIFYPCELNHYNQTEVFLETVLNQLIQTYSLSDSTLPDHATDNGWFLSAILQQVSDLLSPNERLIIIIDGCDRLNHSTQPPGSNLLYLPRYLPDKVYILLSRRPFLLEQSRLLIETPHQILDLRQYPEQNQQDIQAYLNQFNLDDETVHRISNQSQSNFKYAVEIVKAISQSSSELPPGLIEYYQNHWQQMTAGNPSELQFNLIHCWTEQNEWLSVETLAEQLYEDEYEIERILEDWVEFLECNYMNSEPCYRWYHSSFCQFLNSIEI